MALDILKVIRKVIQNSWEPLKILLATVGITTVAATAINAETLSENFVKFATTLLGTLVGAALAFRLNRYQQKRKQNDDDKASLALAANIVGGQIDDFLGYRSNVFRGIKDVERNYSVQNVPVHGIALWQFIRPMEYPFNPANELELKDLAFLVSDHTKKDLNRAFSRLQLTGRNHVGIIQIAQRLQDTAIEVQQKLAERHRSVAPEQRTATTAIYEEYLGPELTHRMIDLTLQMIVRLEGDLSIYVETLEQLRKGAMILWEDEAPPKWRMDFTGAEALPELPSQLRRAIDAVRQQLV